MKKYIETKEYDDGSRGRFEKLNGKHDGLWQIFYPNGKIKWERQMSKGLDHGYSRKFNQDDYLVEERYYFKDVLDGCSKIFDDMGRLKEETFFDMGYALREKVYDAEGNVIKDETKDNLVSYDATKLLNPQWGFLKLI
ncbi:hypothetical protein phytr_11110 [Candidatus Phycorickettsia trachydisci]|uniref:Uncharacterized protein n=1 Tax=Candidatus Phycorickettsia trachydisci TaxID=2115978 RepID=A0A2P1P9W9_9RICK|nr:hypothetical protein [Candidatus Phycorickettsia trachydisci]AVP88036.1 hypothetical protein phytr_11110 [Candidatus Phycorickettsia trachydisci]